MLRVSLWCFMIVLVFAAGVCAMAAQPEYNLLGETDFSSWQLPDGCSLQWEDEASVLSVASASASAIFAVAAAPVDGNSVKTVRVDASVKVVDGKAGVNSWDKPRIHLTFHDRLGRQLGGWPELDMWTGTFDWKPVSRKFQVPAGTASVRVYAGLHNASGTVMFKDIAVYALDAKGNFAKPSGDRKANDTSLWYPWKAGGADLKKLGPTAVDISWILDKPAGKHGFVNVRNGKFYFADGTRARFIGVDIAAAACFPEKEDARLTAQRLARFGVNIVRLHHMDASWSDPNIFGGASSTKSLDKNSLDKLDYFIYQLKNNGIYVCMDLLVHRKFSDEDGVRDADQVENGAKVTGQFDDRMIYLQKLYAKQLLTHKNPYTKRRYVDEPAVAMMDIINESSVFWEHEIPEYYTGELTAKWNKWLLARYKDRDGLEGAWRSAGAKSQLKSTEDPAKGTVPLPPKSGSVDVRKEDYFRFLYGLQTNYYLDMRKYVRDLGVRVPVTGSNHWEQSAADVASNAKTDFVDNHGYWDHPQGGYGDDVTFNNSPMVADLGNLVSGLAAKRMAMKPYTITEWQCAWPNEYRFEGPLIVTSYSMLQDWDALFQFDYTGYDWGSRIQGNFDVGNKPDIFAQWPAIALMFHRHDVAESPNTLTSKISEADLYKGISIGSGIPGYAPLVDKVQTVFNADRTAPITPSQVEGFYDSRRRTASSRTGELTWNGDMGLVTVNTPRSQGAVGFIGGSKTDLGDVAIDVSTEFASVIVTSLDSKPIRQSGKILLTSVARAENSGTVYNSTRTHLDNPGTAPVLMEPVVGSVSIKLEAPEGGVLVYTLDAYGRRKAKAKSVFKDGTLTVALRPEDKTPWYEIVLK